MARCGNPRSGKSASEISRFSSTEGVYWQVGKSATDCFQDLYVNQLWTDVRIRCREHVASNPEDALRAHKAILAARSPVFRYLYTDRVTPETEEAAELFKLAHFYQVTSLVDICSDLLTGRLTIGNACAILDVAVLYDVPTLREIAVDFIDVNAGAVLNSVGFLVISRDTLEYLLKGDTLFATEVTIAECVYRWATTNLRISDKHVTVDNIRDLLGNALYYLRITTLSLEEFLTLEENCSFHTRGECLDLIAYIATGRPQNVHSHARSGSRVPKVQKVTFAHNSREFHSDTSIVSQLYIKSHKHVKVTEIGIAVPFFFVRFRVSANECVRLVESALQLRVNVLCPQTGFEQARTMAMQGEKVVTITLDPPLILEGSMLKDYSLKITISCPSLPNICFHQYEHSTVNYGNEKEGKVTITNKMNLFMKSLTFVQHSGRQQKDERASIKPKGVDTSWDQNLKYRLERVRLILAVATVIFILFCIFNFVLTGEVITYEQGCSCSVKPYTFSYIAPFNSTDIC